MKKNIVVLGGGESGVGAALLAQRKGYNVFLSDMGPISQEPLAVLKANNIDFEQNQHSKEKVFEADEVIKSPGIPDDAPLIREILSKAIPVIGEIEFASRYTQAKLISITGTNGKTTTSLLLYHLLKQAGLNVGLAGNIGKSFARQVMEESFDIYVLELSSFQLDNIDRFKSDIAILLNITPDHLNRYQNNIDLYTASKFRILKNSGPEDQFVYFYDDDTIKAYHEQVEFNVREWPLSLLSELSIGAFLDDDFLRFKGMPIDSFKLAVNHLPLKGRHNMVNIMAAVTAAMLVGVQDEKIKAALPTFKSVAHRLEPVGNVGGIAFINDSKATNVDATSFALGAFENPIVWIAGGIDKGNDYYQVLSAVQQNVRALICLGVENQKLKTFFTDAVDTIEESQSMKEAVTKAKDIAVAGDIVLLSPACASFDLFRNYEDRGDQFKLAVKALMNQNKEEV